MPDLQDFNTQVDEAVAAGDQAALLKLQAGLLKWAAGMILPEAFDGPNEIEQAKEALVKLESWKEAPGKPEGVSSEGPFRREVFHEFLLPIEEQDELVTYVVMSARDFNALRTGAPDLLDVETRRDHLRAGIMGQIWSATILVNNSMTEPGTMYVMGSRKEDRLGHILVATVGPSG